MPRGAEHISFVFSSAFRDFLDVIMISFFQFSIRNMVFHCIFLGKKAIIITSKRQSIPFSSPEPVVSWSRGRLQIKPSGSGDENVSIQSYSKKTLRKNVPKSARKYKRNVLMPPWHPIILLKSNEFNMAAVSVKRSVHELLTYQKSSEIERESEGTASCKRL